MSMAKAEATLPNGVCVTVTGESTEIAKILQLLSGHARSAVQTRGSKQIRVAKHQSGPKEYIRTLKGEGFFKIKRNISDVQKKLEENGHIYTLSGLSPRLLELTRLQELRRIKESGVWNYVNP